MQQQRPETTVVPVPSQSPVLGIPASSSFQEIRAGGARAFDPAKDEPLQMPQAFDSNPGVTFEQFVAAVAQAREGKIAVLTFHGVPDGQHPWVNTESALFEKYLAHLKEQGCMVIAVREMAKYLPVVP